MSRLPIDRRDQTSTPRPVSYNSAIGNGKTYSLPRQRSIKETSASYNAIISSMSPAGRPSFGNQGPLIDKFAFNNDEHEEGDKDVDSDYEKLINHQLSLSKIANGQSNLSDQIQIGTDNSGITVKDLSFRDNVETGAPVSQDQSKSISLNIVSNASTTPQAPEQFKEENKLSNNNSNQITNYSAIESHVYENFELAQDNSKYELARDHSKYKSINPSKRKSLKRQSAKSVPASLLGNSKENKKDDPKHDQGVVDIEDNQIYENIILTQTYSKEDDNVAHDCHCNHTVQLLKMMELLEMQCSFLGTRIDQLSNLNLTNPQDCYPHFHGRGVAKIFYNSSTIDVGITRELEILERAMDKVCKGKFKTYDIQASWDILKKIKSTGKAKSVDFCAFFFLFEGHIESGKQLLCIRNNQGQIIETFQLSNVLSSINNTVLPGLLNIPKLAIVRVREIVPETNNKPDILLDNLKSQTLSGNKPPTGRDRCILKVTYQKGTERGDELVQELCHCILNSMSMDEIKRNLNQKILEVWNSMTGVPTCEITKDSLCKVFYWKKQ